MPDTDTHRPPQRGRGQVTTAVVPAAGLGTRFLPATKVIPKELLPLVDTPAIEYVVAEAAAAGLPDVLLITGRGKDAILDHFDANPELERVLETKGDKGRLAAVRRSTDLAQVHAVRQGVPLGLGHAVLQAAAHVGDAPFAVLLGDDLIDPRDPLLRRMLDVQATHGGSVVGLLEVPADQIHLYGCAAVRSLPTGGDDLVEITGLVEKPPTAEAPSNLAIIGRYVLAPEVFAILRDTPPGRGGEIQLTDALAVLADRGALRGVVFRGRRYDTGDRLEWLKATIGLAVEREDVGPGLRRFLRELVPGLPA
ncbi:MAG TPA: UTP--glucose-1-phosphate uridylyltransferase [Mycobacteriales bacterium]|jgi:UTP--glucose-1-phosphate uridylyltransferase|nr:UTP--glucose-1-phosphate uridylyltransferase [Mycobacteriales bacterium]